MAHALGTLLFLLISTFAMLPTTPADDAKQTPCSSPIYCYGNLLHTVQMASIYPDSKTFVDMKLKVPPEEALASFERFMEQSGQTPSHDEIARFVNETFDPAGSEFMPFDLPDWIPNPKFLNKIRDLELRKFASNLNDIWNMLGRKIRDEVRETPDLYSIIYVPNPIVVPGGRFREFYYWDSYWIIKGLLLSEMYQTAEGMLSNFLSIVDKFGFIPNGGRVYYTNRSQPPLLIPMVSEYLKATKDYDWLKKNLWLLEKEFNFWITNRMVQVEKDGFTYNLARYIVDVPGPRPESYREDFISSQHFRSNEEKDNHYAELKTAAESGWDFSSRWFILDGTNQGNLTDMKARYIVPVDLNAMMYRNAVLLAEFNEILGNHEAAAKYRKLAEEWIDAVTAILWHDEVGVWLDYDIANDKKRDYFYPSNVVPLWAGCYEPSTLDDKVAKLLKYLEKSQVIQNLGGVPSSFEHTGEQWDYPNAWPPSQYFVIVALDQTNISDAQTLAYELSKRWVLGNYKAYNETQSMYEKYDATIPGGYGTGGEYEVQLGFGWSNGIVMDLLHKYGDRLIIENHSAPPNVSTEMRTCLTAIVMAIIGGIIGFFWIFRTRQFHLESKDQSTKLNPQTQARKFNESQNNEDKNTQEAKGQKVDVQECQEQIEVENSTSQDH